MEYVFLLTGQHVVALPLSATWAGTHRDMSQTGGEISRGDHVDQRRSSVSLSTRAGCLTAASDKRQRERAFVWSLVYLIPSLAPVIPRQPPTNGWLSLQLQYFRLTLLLL